MGDDGAPAREPTAEDELFKRSLSHALPSTQAADEVKKDEEVAGAAEADQPESTVVVKVDSAREAGEQDKEEEAVPVLESRKSIVVNDQDEKLDMVAP